MSSLESDHSHHTGVDIFEKLSESDVSGDSGIGDDSDLSDFLEKAWREETGYDQFIQYDYDQQPFNPHQNDSEKKENKKIETFENLTTHNNDNIEEYKDTDTEVDDKECTEDWRAGEDSVPSGWQITGLEGGTSLIISRTGVQFHSRREAFQALCREEGSEEELAELFDCLVYEDFQASDLLPVGWVFQASEAGLSFLSSGGLYISSLSEADNYFKNSLHPEEYEHFQQFVSNIQSIQEPEDTVEDSEEWRDHEDLPRLWKYRLVEGSPQFFSREGKLLESSGSAIHFISRNSPPYGDIDVERIELFTRKLLSEYGNSQEEEISDNTATTEEDFNLDVTSDGTMDTTSGVTPNETSCVTPNETSGVTPNETSGVTPDVNFQYGKDSSVPPGWMLRLDGGHGVLSPSGGKYRSRAHAFRAMVRQGHTNQQIEEMRNCLKYEDWLDNPELPSGWKVRPTSSSNQYMDRGGQVFQSAVKAARFVEEYIEHYSPEDLERINKVSGRNQPKKESDKTRWSSSSSLPSGWLYRQMGKRNWVMDPSGRTYKSVRFALEQVMMKGELSQAEILRAAVEAEGWSRIKELPGWLYKHNGGNVFNFIAPNGELLGTRNKALGYLAKAGCLSEVARSAINRVRECKEPIAGVEESLPRVPVGGSISIGGDTQSFDKEESDISISSTDENSDSSKSPELRRLAKQGWVENDFLPDGWLCRKTKPGSFILVLSPQRRRFTTYKSVLEHLRENEIYKEEDIERFKRFPDGAVRPRLESMSVPRKHQKRFSMRQYQQALEKGEGELGEVGEIREQLRGRGWKEDRELVPRGWMFRQKSGVSNMEFINEKGHQLNSAKEANKYLSENNMNFMIDVKLCREAFVDNYELELKMIERRTNPKNKSPASLPPIPAGITITPVATAQKEDCDEFRLEKFHLDKTSLSSDFQNVFKQLEDFKKNNTVSNKRLRSTVNTIDEIDNL